MKLNKLAPFIFMIAFIPILWNCIDTKSNDNEAPEIAKKSFTEKEIVQVEIQKVKKGDFAKELVCNGRLSALSKAIIPFKIHEQITAVNVVNGQRVKKGQLLAQVESFKYQKAVTDCQNQFEKANIDLEDKIIAFGYSINDTASMPSNILKMAKIQSNYNQALSDLHEARYNYSNTSIRAPFDGVICNLEAKAHNPSSNYEKCCDIINDALMHVELSVLENEIQFVKKGQKVELKPFALSNQFFYGEITSVNPSIDENGMIAIGAKVKNSNGQLMDGMNTQIIIKKTIEDCIAIPRSAVLYRQNRKVVFVHEDNLAKWVYVETGNENSTHITIADRSLKPGQEVIISNNLNLAHETPVNIVN